MSVLEKMQQLDISSRLDEETCDPAPSCTRFTCETCGGRQSWIDIYGNGPHCVACSPWPARSFVRSTSRAEAEASPLACDPGEGRLPGWSPVDRASCEVSGTQELTETEEELDREWNQRWVVHEVVTKNGTYRYIWRRGFSFTQAMS